MKKIKFFLMTAVAALLAFSCTQELEDTLTMVSAEFNVSDEGGELPLQFNANTNWTIECDQDWVSFDYVSGKAGDNTVIATVEANDTYEPRTATITLVAGAKTTAFAVKQGYSEEFASEVLYEIDAKAQTIEFDINANVECSFEIEESAKSWISNTPVKAAPQASKLVFSVTANSALGSRTGKIYVKTGAVSQCLVVKQNAEFAELSEPQVIFLGRSMDVYNGSDLYYDEYALVFKTEEGTVTLALNYAVSETPLESLPAGEFVVDAVGKHEAGTFAIKKTDNSEKYYTTIVENDSETKVEDGEISVTVENGNYTIVAVLMDAAEKPHRYSYTGELGTIEDKSEGAEITGVSFKNTFNTFFTSKLNQWTVTLRFAKTPEAFAETSINRIEFNLFGATGEVADKTALPTGTFNVVEEKKIPDASGDGIWDVKAGDVVLSAGNLGCVNYREYMGSPVSGTIDVSKNDNGTYNFKFNVTYNLTKKNAAGTQEAYKDNVVFEAEYTEIPLTVSPSDTQIYPAEDPQNGDVVTIKPIASTYQVYDYGDAFNVGGSVVAMDFSQFCGGTYSLYLGLQMDVAYEHNGGMFGVYSTIPVAQGEYIWATEPAAGTKSVLPLRYGTNKTSECWFQNYITKTKWNVIGGKVKVGSDDITLDLMLSNQKEGAEKVEFTLKGTCPISIMYGMEYSSYGSKLSLEN